MGSVPNQFENRMNRKAVTTSGMKRRPRRGPIVFSQTPTHSSTISSQKFCTPDGIRRMLRVEKYANSTRMAITTQAVKIELVTGSHGMPNR